MALYNKIKWIIGILLIFALIIATNLIDKNNFVRVRDSVETIYEDRLVANDLIYKMLTSVHQKELALYASDTAFYRTQNPKLNTDLQSYVSRFEETKLTSKETTVFKDLKANVKVLEQVEKQYMNSGFRKSTQVSSQITKLKDNLDDLSEIQLNEGSRQLSISNKALQDVELFTQIEIYVLVFLAIMIQIIVMYKPKEKS